MTLWQGKVYVEDLRQEMQAFASEIMSASLEAPMMALGPLVREDFAAHFAQKQGPDGPWPPRVRSYPWPMLVKTGFLMTAATQEGAPGNIALFRDGWAEFGVDGSVVNYAGFHEYGTTKLPPRPWTWLSADAQDEAEQQLADSLFVLFVGPNGS